MKECQDKITEVRKLCRCLVRLLSSLDKDLEKIEAILFNREAGLFAVMETIENMAEKIGGKKNGSGDNTTDTKKSA